MSRNVAVTLSTAIVTAALALSGCSHHDTAAKVDATEVSVPAATATTLAAPPTAPLPAPEVFTDLLNRLSDPGVPGKDKLNLVEGATADTAAALDRFTSAARDGGYLPMVFHANNLAWSAKDPTDVMATVVVNTANPEHREFTFPMEFNSFQGGWQLSKKTAEMLLAMQNARSTNIPSSSSAPSSPSPAAGPSAGPAPSPTP